MEISGIEEGINLPSKIKWQLNRIFLGKGYSYDQYVYDWIERQIVANEERRLKNKPIKNIDGLIMSLYSKLRRERDDSKEAHVY